MNLEGVSAKSARVLRGIIRSTRKVVPGAIKKIGRGFFTVLVIFSLLFSNGLSVFVPQLASYIKIAHAEGLGCTDPSADNYDPLATEDDGSCSYPPPDAFGCMDPGALNYDPGANVDDGSCNYDVWGCTDPGADNYDGSATIDDGSCTYPPIYGCMDPGAENYDPGADTDDGSCSYPPTPGCMDPAALNYDSMATEDDGSCTYPDYTPTGISLNGSLGLKAGKSIGTTIGSFYTSAQDGGGAYTYSLECASPGVDDSHFSISGEDLLSGEIFDYENPTDDDTDNSYEICVRSTEAETGTYDQNFTIVVYPTNTAPTDSSLSANVAQENEPIQTAKIGTLSATDSDVLDANTHSFSLSCSVAGVDDAHFAVAGGNYLYAASRFDYENPVDADSNNQYEICLRATDPDGESFDKNFTVSVADTDETSYGFVWTDRTDAFEDWTSIASSADGTKLAATTASGYIYTSTDSGATWTAQLNSGQHYRGIIVSSADGTKLTATTEGGYIWSSTDSGVTWTSHSITPGVFTAASLASSADGTKLILSDWSHHHFYTSTNSGVTWTEQTSITNNWGGVASSADGTKLVAVRSNFIDFSTDSGVNWTSVSMPGYQFTSITSSADGTKLAALSSYSVLTSTDSGENWTEHSIPELARLITSSSDGTKLAVVGYSSLYSYLIFTSSDFGDTWVAQPAPGLRSWKSIASSADGKKLFAVGVRPDINQHEKGDIWTAVENGPLTISFASPTPTDGATITQNAFEVKTDSSALDGNHYVFTDLNHSALGWWKFSTNANDSIGVSNGSWNGTESYGSGIFGTAGDFDGASYVDATLSNPITGSFTISTWVNLDTVTESAAIVSDTDGHLLQIGGSDRWQFAGVYDEDTTATTGAWTHVVGVYDAPSHTQTLYVNGVSVASGIADRTVGTDINIGRRQDTGEGGQFIDGKIDDTMIFDRALGADEILALFNATETQYDHTFSSLADGSYTFKGYAVDSEDHHEETGERTITVTEGPTEISSCADFENIANDLAGSYLLMNDLPCAGEENAIMVGTNDNPFTGIFNGNGHTITVAIDVDDNYIGLFRKLSGATIENVRIAGSVAGATAVGALAGVADDSTIKYVGSTATVTGTVAAIGGLAGWISNGSQISNSYSHGNVNASGTYGAGGLVGTLFNGAGIDRSYATGAVTGYIDVGGLAGKGDSGAGTISRSFAAGHVTGNINVGGFIGEKLVATLVNDYFDSETTGMGANCAGDTSDACSYANGENSTPNYFKNNFSNTPMYWWDFSGVWQTTSEYPELRSTIITPSGSGTEEDPYEINSCGALTTVNDNLDGFYELTANIDCSTYGNGVMIGTEDAPFTGHFNGGGHQITIDIDSLAGNYIGLFAKLSGAAISNLWINGSISSRGHAVGGLAGFTNGNTTISEVVSTVDVSGIGSNYGGLVGFAQGGTVISNSYVNSTVESGTTAGGIVGFLDGSFIDHAYSVGSVTTSVDEAGGIVGYMTNGSAIQTVFSAAAVSAGTINKGGLVGNLIAGDIIGSYWDTVSSHLDFCVGSTEDDVVGCTPDDIPYDFKNNNVNPPFSGVGDTDYDWDFDAIWEVTRAGYPSLQSITDDELSNSPFAGGDGSGDDPYEITTCSGLAAINEVGLDKYYILNNNLNCTQAGNLIMIGTEDAPFTGHFNGGGHTITVAISADGDVGIFRHTNNATISRIRVAGTVTGTGTSVGGLVGDAGTGTTIDQVVNTADVRGNFNTGGIAGSGTDITITNSYNLGAISSNNDEHAIGGILGYADGSGLIDRNYNAGTVGRSDEFRYYIGGILGWRNSAGTTVSNNFNVGAIQSSYPVYGAITGADIPSNGSIASGYSNNFFDLTRSGVGMCLSDGATGAPLSEDGRCQGINGDGMEGDYFKGNSTSAPFTIDDSPVWDFSSTWFTVENDYPQLSGIEYPDSPILVTPADGSVVTTWAPVVDWKDSTICEYKYTDGGYSTLDCSLNGADIPLPADSYKNTTLTIRGTTDSNDVLTTTSTFFYYPLTQGGNTGGELPWIEQMASPAVEWTRVAMSADGSHLAGVVFNGYIHTSTDFGETWTEQTDVGISNWDSVAISATGQYILAGSRNGNYFLTNNYGSTWRALDGDGEPGSRTGTTGVSVSADGKYMIAAGYGYYWYTSDDFGTTWNIHSDFALINFNAISVSATGQYVAVATTDNHVLLSDDYGATWTVNDAPNESWVKVAVAADGTHLVAAAWGSHVYTSEDFGDNWTEHANSGDYGWSDIIVSADGSVILASPNFTAGDFQQDQLLVSVDGGDTWFAQSTPGTRYWTGAALSADGTRFAAGSVGTHLFTALVDTGDDEGGGGEVTYDAGDGSQETPYEISTCRQLQGIGQDDEHLAAHYILTDDVDCSATSISDSEDPNFDSTLYNDGEGFDPIGDSDHPFTGSISGDKGDDAGWYRIENLFMDRESDSYLGLFAATDLATITHLNMDDAEIENDGSQYVGGFVGYANRTSIDNVRFFGEVYGSRYTGGIAGYFTDSNEGGDDYGIDDSYVYVELTTGGPSSYDFGGAVGYLDYGYIHNVHSGDEGTNIIDGSDGAVDIGGMVGFANHATISNSYAHTEVTGHGEVGGFVGHMQDSVVTGNTVDTTVHGGTEDIPANWNNGYGGLVGISQGGDTIEANTVHATLNVFTDYAYVQAIGGALGALCWNGNNCHFNDNEVSGTVTVTMATEEEGWNDIYDIGGMVGYANGYSEEENGPVAMNNNTADVSIEVLANGGANSYQSVNELGGLIGYSDYGNITHSSSSGDILIHSDTDTETNMSISYVGGLVGDLESFSRFNDNTSEGSITITNKTTSGQVASVGGLVGYSEGDEHANIQRSYSTTDLDITGYGIYTIGGLIGRAYDPISQSYASGDITITPWLDGGEVYSVGGLIGTASEEPISDTYATGSITVNTNEEDGRFTTASDIGGLIGEIDGPISRSYSAGAVTVTASDVSNLGGLVGRTYGALTGNFTVSHLSQLSDTNARLGGMVGSVDDVSLMANNYFDMGQVGYEGCASVETSNEECQAINTGALGDTTDATYFKENTINPPLDSWNFDSIWATQTDNYPYLQMNVPDFEWLAGDGSENDPYLIDSCNALQYINNDLSAHYQLTRNISCDNIIPIGIFSQGFSGVLDGDNYTVTYTENVDGFYGLGLFWDIVGGTVRDLNVEATLTGIDSNYAGALTGGFFDGAYLENVHGSGTITVSGNSIGGLIGETQAGGTIYNSTFRGEVTGNEQVGGLVGLVNQSGITIVGSRTGGTVHGNEAVGGLVGWIDFDGEDSLFERNTASGTVTGETKVGGLIGFAANGSIHDVYANGDVSGYDNVGGLIGEMEDIFLRNAYAAGQVTANGFDFETDNDSIGGLIGLAESGNIIRNSWSASDVRILIDTDTYAYSDESAAYIGGFVGQSGGSEANIFSNIYYDRDLSHQSDCDGSGGDLDCTEVNGEGSEPNYFINPITAHQPFGNGDFMNWDLTTIWQANSTEYPSLREFGIPSEEDEVGGVSGSYRYLKWDITQIREADSCDGLSCVQASEFTPLLDGEAVSLPEGTTVTNPHGVNPEEELPGNLIDGDLNTTWLDLNFYNGFNDIGDSVAIIDAGSGNTISLNGYRFATVNDRNDSDPVSWKLYGSTDGVRWVLLDSRVDQRATHEGYTHDYGFNAPPEEALVAHWNLDEGEGGEALDSSNNENDGVLQGGPTWISGIFGGALHFDGSQSVTIPSSHNIPIGNNPYTISAWFKSDVTTGMGGIIGWGNYGIDNQTTALRKADIECAEGTYGFRHYWWGNDLDGCSETNMYDGEWHQVVTTYDGITRKMFLDNNLLTSDIPGAHAIYDASNLALGITAGGEYWNGDLDDLRIYNYALGASDLEILYEHLVPNQVTDLSIETVSHSEITLSWSAPTPNEATVTGYKIERESPIGGGWDVIVSDTKTTNTTYTDTDLSPVTEYNYRVSAVTAVGETGAASEEVSATTDHTPHEGAVKIVVVDGEDTPIEGATIEVACPFAEQFNVIGTTGSDGILYSNINISGTDCDYGDTGALEIGIQFRISATHYETTVVPFAGQYFTDIDPDFENTYHDGSNNILTVSLISDDSSPEDTETETPVLSSPVSSQTYVRTSSMDITFTLPEDMLAGSLVVTFIPTSGDSIVMHLRDAESGHANTFSITPSGGINTVEEVTTTSANSIPNGTYTVVLSYQDASGNPAATVTVTDVNITTPAPSGGGGGGGGYAYPSNGTTNNSGTGTGCLPGYIVNPMTGVFCSQIGNGNSQSTNQTNTTVYQFARNLTRGMQGEDVLKLQEFLNKNGAKLAENGPGAPGRETTRFSSRTFNALIRYQEAHAKEILGPEKLKKGTGYFGPNTRAFINAILRGEH
jgi:hypothetical protein